MDINQILQGDCLEVLRGLPENLIDCCVTSPPYWGLRDYGVCGQLGLEKTPEEYVTNMVEVFREVKRILKNCGTLWLNLGDTYFGSGCGTNDYRTPASVSLSRTKLYDGPRPQNNREHESLKPKDLVGIPWMVAFALRADGWYLRQDIIWSKPNPMPESVRDRCTKSHEYVFLLSKSSKYYFDNEAIKETAKSTWNPNIQKTPDGWDTGKGSHGTINRVGREKGHKKMSSVLYPNGNPQVRENHDPHDRRYEYFTANKRSVWTVNTKPYKEAHFATYPPELIKPMILAGCPKGGIILDPFMGAGTTGLVAKNLGRNYLGIELNPEYIKLATKRINGELFI
jgi:DNA modification methylase